MISKAYKKIILGIAIFFVMASVASAQLTPTAVPNFSGIVATPPVPVCLNGYLIAILTPIPIVLLVSYVPITPIVPAVKLWGMIPGTTTIGNFFWAGICETPVGGIPVAITGTLIQAGSTLVPTVFVPVQVF